MTTNRLIIVIVMGGCQGLVQRLLDANLHVTEFGSMGGFLRHKSTTLMLGVPADDVDRALALIRAHCPTPSGSDEHNATIFVLKAGQFITV